MLLKHFRTQCARVQRARLQRHADFGPRPRARFCQSDDGTARSLREAGFGCSPAALAGKKAPEAALEWIEHGASRASSVQIEQLMQEWIEFWHSSAQQQLTAGQIQTWNPSVRVEVRQKSKCPFGVACTEMGGILPSLVAPNSAPKMQSSQDLLPAPSEKNGLYSLANITFDPIGNGFVHILISRLSGLIRTPHWQYLPSWGRPGRQTVISANIRVIGLIQNTLPKVDLDRN